MTESITPPPAPAFLSDAARAGLEQPIMRIPNPALDDVAGWTTMVEQADSMIAGMFSGLTLPVES